MYRQIDVRIWNDEKFRKLNDRSKLLFLMILTHPQMTPIGALRANPESLAFELRWQVDAIRDAIRDAISYGMLDGDFEAGLIVAPNFLKYNAPTSPNFSKSWLVSLEMLPECALLRKHIKTAVYPCICRLSEGFRKSIDKRLMDAIEDAKKDAIGDGIGMVSDIQEQEQEQEQEISRDSKESLVDATATTLSLSGEEKKEKVKSVLDECPYKALIDAYHEECPMMPRVLYETFMASPSRKKHMKARWLWFTKEQGCKTQEDGIREFRDYFNAAATFPFLNGQNSRGFRANLDWLLNATNMGKVIEGRYQ